MSTAENMKIRLDAAGSDIYKPIANIAEESRINQKDASYNSGFKQGAKLAWDVISAPFEMIGSTIYSLVKPTLYMAANAGSASEEDIRTAIAENRLSPEQEKRMQKYNLSNSVSR